MPEKTDANLQNLTHDHVFGQDQKRAGELRTIIVIIITTSMMIIEITTGLVFGSMALLADGLHMASHAIALAINAFAYIYARRHAHDTRYRKSQCVRWICWSITISHFCFNNGLGKYGTVHKSC